MLLQVVETEEVEEAMGVEEEEMVEVAVVQRETGKT